MKYKIKITTFENGRCEYRAYVKKWLFWCGLDLEGKEQSITYAPNLGRKSWAREAISNHHKGNYKVKSIDTEYITIEGAEEL